MGYYIKIEWVVFVSKLQMDKLKPKGAKQFSPYGSTNRCENWRRDLVFLSRHSWEPQMPGSALSTLYWVFHLVSAVLKDVHSLGWYRQAGLSVFGERKAILELGKDWKFGDFVCFFRRSQRIPESGWFANK